MGFDSFTSQNFSAEEKKLAGLLRVARNRALKNIDNNSHGLFINSESFILFQGENFSDFPEKNEIFPRNSFGISHDQFNDEIEIVFERLSGRVLSGVGKLKIYDAGREVFIGLGYEGQIDW